MNQLNRRAFVTTSLIAASALAAPRLGLAQAGLTPTSLVLGPADTATIFPMIALERGFAKEEGLDLKITVTDAGVQTRQVLAAGQTEFAIGDNTHPLQLTNRGKPCQALFATATFPTTANMVVRKDLFDAGVNSPEKFAAWKREDGGKPIIAATQIGASTWTYGSYVFDKLGLGNNVNWVSGGSAQNLLGGLKSKQFDAIMAQPGWMFEAVDNKWGGLIFDPLDPNNLNRIFGGEIPVGAVIYAQKSTVTSKTEVAQALVNAIYKAGQWVKTASADEIYEVVGGKYLGGGHPEATKREITYYKTDKVKIYNYSGVVDEAEYKRVAPIWFREGTGITEVPFADAYNFTFVDKATQKG